MERSVLVVMALLAITTVQAADYSWDGGGTDDSWTTSENWVGDLVPNGQTGTGKVFIRSGDVEMGSDVDIAMTSHLYVGGAGSGSTGDARLTVNGGILSSSNGYCILGYNAADTGTLVVNSGSVSFQSSNALGLGIGWFGTGMVEINGGTINADRLSTSFKLSSPGGSSFAVHGGNVNVSGPIRIANFDGQPAAGTLSDSVVIDGGMVTCSSYFTVGVHSSATLDLSGSGAIQVADYFKVGGASYSVGQMTMAGGTLTCAELIVGGDAGGVGVLDLLGGIIAADTLTMNAGGIMDIAGGTLVLDGNITDISTYGNILAHSGYGTFVYDYDSMNNVTEITAIPEPATMLLLGLGGLLFLKKRRV